MNKNITEDPHTVSDNVYRMLKEVCDISLMSQKINEKDHVNKDGILICGICGKPKEKYMKVEGRETLKHRIQCACETGETEKSCNESFVEKIRNFFKNSWKK